MRSICKVFVAFHLALTMTIGVQAEPQRKHDASAPAKQSVDYVDPNIGGIGHLLTSVPPEVQVPHGMIRVAPAVAIDVTDIYLAERLEGFSGSGTILMPFSGAPGAELTSEIDHDKEKVAPYDASYVLDRDGTRVEYTATQHSMLFRFTFHPGAAPHLLLKAVESAEYVVTAPNSISATEDREGTRTYIHIELSQPATSVISFGGGKAGDAARKAGGKGAALLLGFAPGVRQCEVKIGVSYISTEQAANNLTGEIPRWDFEAAAAKARASWNESLDRIHVQGGTEEQKKIFYTALYRSLQYMADATEDGHFLGPFDHQVHDAEGHHFYIEDNLWDTYRSRHPLQVLIEPDSHPDVLRSYVEMYRESGWMPHFPYMKGDLPIMLGNHAAAMFADAYFKGERGFDVEKAYEGLRKNATELTMLPYRLVPLTELDKFYHQNGYFPALRKGEVETEPAVDKDMRRQAVAVTLETSYDDWTISRLARALSKTADANYFAKRGQNYRNVFNSGQIAPRSADGKFIEDFNPKWSGGQAGRDYFTECTGLVYQFHVQQDVAGLIALMGGREAFVTRLDNLFAEGYDGRLKFEFLAQFPDSTALVGQYPQGNEPAFHIPYLYNYAGAPWKTQKRLRDIMRVWYAAQPLGLPGDDDNGATSSWFVFSAMGFYPVTPGTPVYAIGSPLFARSEVAVGGGKVFRIVAQNVSALNKYIQSATLDGKPLNRPWFSHSDVLRGATLVLQMGPNPNKQWGSAPEDAPPTEME